MTESTLAYFFMAWLNPHLLLLTAAGTLAGIYVGAIPGLSVTMAVSILISFTFSWDVNNALALMVCILRGSVRRVAHGHIAQYPGCAGGDSHRF